MSYDIHKLKECLSRVIDPDFQNDIISLSMVENLRVAHSTCYLTLVLTTPACPLKEGFKTDIVREITNVYPELAVEIAFTSRVTTQRSLNQATLGNIKNIVLVSSGKGGVGKSTIACNLAVGLAQKGASVGLLDADIHGPSVPSLMGLEDAKPAMIQEGAKYKMVPVERFGVNVLSMGMLVDPKQPVVFRGPMQASALKQLLLDVEWGNLDYLFIDLPPGTGDIHLSLAQQFPVTGAVVVTTPQKISVADTRKSIEMFLNPQTAIHLLGIIENMSWFTPQEHPDERYYLFGSGGGEELAAEYHLPLLAQVPLIAGMPQRADTGTPAVLNRLPSMSGPFVEMVERVAQRIAIANAQVQAEVKQ
ncbi:MAG: Mrp/NBP35 family ATP-binding protein [Bacteroidetes bacterium]|nr:Mrp/NBP35 family ATP-binding protein [Bacteroidota bacterium]